jgi:hypothetical protein
LGAHANKPNAYAGCHRGGYWGCDFRGSDGYVTLQQSSAFFAAFCHIPGQYVDEEGRALMDQNYNAAPNLSPATELALDGSSFVFNNVLEPYFPCLDKTDSIVVGKTGETAVLWTVCNNIANGVEEAGIASTMLQTNGWRTNMMTSGVALIAAAGTDTVVSPYAVYTDVVKGDTSISLTSPSRSATTTSVASIITTLKSWFPGETCFDYDASGAVYDQNNPPMGPYVNPSNPLPLPAFWIDKPEFVGTPLVGNTLTLTDGYRIGWPFPSVSYQWQTSTDLINWTNVSGANSASHAYGAGDVGKYPGVLLTVANASGTDVVRVFNASAIASSFPIANPALITPIISDSTNAKTSWVTAPFSCSNKPLLVVVSHRLAGTTAAAQTVTVGVSGGSRTAVPQFATGIRSSVQFSAHYIQAPGTGTFTIEVGSALSSNGARIAVYELDGATGSGAVGTVAGITGGVVNPAVTTSMPNSLIFYVAVKSHGGASDDMTITGGATELDQGDTGGITTASDAITIIGVKQKPAAGADTATITGTVVTSVATTSVGFEILS